MSEDADRFKAVLSALVKDSTRHLPFALGYPCTVLKDWGDGHVDLQPISDALPPMTRIPLRVGFPGLTWKIQAGAGVLLGFDSGEADAPYCYALDGAALELVSVRTSTGASIVIDEGRGGSSDDGKGAPGATFITLTHPAGQVIQMLPNGDIAITAAGNTLINGGGPAAARLGDAVLVDGKVGSIISGSGSVFIG